MCKMKHIEITKILIKKPRFVWWMSWGYFGQRNIKEKNI